MATANSEKFGIAASPDHELSITRTFDAPREKMWQAWTEPERLAQWWGPKGCDIKVISLELRPGGAFHYSMDLPNGDIWYGKFTYREVVAPERLVYTSSFADKSGNAIRAPFSPEFPLLILNTLTFSEQDGKTTLHLSGGPLDASTEEQQFFAGMRASMQQGFDGTFDQLAEYLAES